MKIKLEIFSPLKISYKNFGERAKKARRLQNNVKLVSISVNMVLFSVIDDESKKEHTVIYRKENPIRWSCDCAYFGTKGDFCTHILAVHLYLYREFRRKNPSLYRYING